MSILIKMEMPKNCYECPMQFGGMCYVQPPEIDEPRVAENIEEASKRRASWCPLIEIPPHGRLIDADALRDKWIWGDTDRLGHTECVEVIDIDDAPTIIEAEGEDGKV